MALDCARRGAVAWHCERTEASMVQSSGRGQRSRLAMQPISKDKQNDKYHVAGERWSVHLVPEKGQLPLILQVSERAVSGYFIRTYRWQAPTDVVCAI
jgi:hypothetical protein